MIDKINDPAAWSLFLYELNDAHEHLGALLETASNKSAYSEDEFRVDLGHVYAHLNRAWHRRDSQENVDESEWAKASRFPDDIDPVG